MIALTVSLSMTRFIGLFVLFAALINYGWSLVILRRALKTNKEATARFDLAIHCVKEAEQHYEKVLETVNRIKKDLGR